MAIDRSIVPAARRAVWDPGIRASDTLPYGWSRGTDGLPNSSLMTVHATAVDSFGNGTNDATTYLQGLLDTCPAGRVVQIPAGRWRVATGGLVVPAGVVLRGAGAGQTYIIQDYSANGTYPDGVVMGGFINSWGLAWDPHDLSVDVASGATTITVTSGGTSFAVGDICLLDQNDVATDGSGNPWIDQSRVDPIGSRSGTNSTYTSGTPRTFKTLVEITNVNGNVLTVKDPIIGDYFVSRSAQLCRGTHEVAGAAWTYARWVGIEGITVTGAVGQSGNIGFKRCAYSWIKGCESNGLLQSGSALNHGCRYSVVLWQSYRCVIRESYIHDTRDYMNNHDAYGIVIRATTTNCLIENNIVIRFDKPIQFQSSGGGNVVGYNYADISIDLTNSLTGGPWQGRAWTDNTIGSHLQCSHHELLEGNHVPQIGPDADHGTTLLFTAFRNWITSENNGGNVLNWTADNAPLPNTTVDLNNIAVRWAENQFYGTTIGNVLLKPSTLKSRIYEYSADFQNNNGNVAYNLSGETMDSRVKASFHRHLDFDYATATVYDNPANPVKTLPDSLYLSEKPAFFGVATWPWVSPSASTKTVTLPAKARFDEGTPLDTTPPSAYTLPADRVTVWAPGVSGGIPIYSTIHTTINTTGADQTSQIQSALTAAGAAAAGDGIGRVVKLGIGNFIVSGNAGALIIPSKVVLRGSGVDGAGAMRTRITLTPSNASTIVVGNHPWFVSEGTSRNLTADATKGAYSVTVASAAGLTAGMLVLVDEVCDGPNTGFVFGDNDRALYNNTRHPYGGGSRGWWCRDNRPLSQIMEIASVNGTTVTFTTPFHITYRTAYTAQLMDLALTPVQYAGVEDLRVSGSGNGTSNGAGVLFSVAKNCWAARVEVENTFGSSVQWYRSTRCTLRDSYLHNAQIIRNGGAGYGVDVIQGSSDNLIENNIIIRFNKVTQFRSSGGGNVVGYNYTDDGGIDNSPDWIETGIQASHYPTPHFELLEGNYSWNADGEFTEGNAIYITFFRNHLSGVLANTVGWLTNGAPKRLASAFLGHRWYNFVGNVLGLPTVNYSSWVADMDQADGAPNAIWRTGFNEYPQFDARVHATQLRDGNFDYKSNALSWWGIGGAGSVADTIPNSLYLNSKPAFFGSASWPWVSPEGTTKVSALPAKARYDSGTPNYTVAPVNVSLMEPVVADAVVDGVLRPFVETDVQLNQGTTPVRLDPNPLRYRSIVKVINPNPAVRVFIGHTQATTNSRCESSDSVNGPWVDLIGPGVQIWAVAEGGANITVRLKQYL